MNLSELDRERLRLSHRIDEGVQELARHAKAHAEAEKEYRKAQAQAWMTAPEGTVPEREAWVNGKCADLRFQRDIEKGLERAADLALRSRQQQMSSWQTWARLLQSEFDHSTYGIEDTP